jgi:hypothetical protein
MFEHEFIIPVARDYIRAARAAGRSDASIRDFLGRGNKVCPMEQTDIDAAFAQAEYAPTNVVEEKA